MKQKLFPLAILVVLVLVAMFSAQCRPSFVPVEITVMATAEFPQFATPASGVLAQSEGGTPQVVSTPRPLPTLASYGGTPTPNPTPPNSQAVLEDGRVVITHNVNSGETLAGIALFYGSSLEEVMESNGIELSDVLSVGQTLRIPTTASQIGPSFKIIPDSELVYGPAAQGFDIANFAQHYNGFLLSVTDVVEGRPLTGPEVVELAAVRYSINPRLLLAVIEHDTGWVTQSFTNVSSEYPMGYVRAGYEGLYLQLGLAANQLNLGYYGRAEGGLGSIVVGDGVRVAFAPDINNGTAAVQNWLASRPNVSLSAWQTESGPSGFFATYNRLFGNPFAFTVDPLWPPGLQQPSLQLPWEGDAPWYFTGGPHGGWAAGAAWAALDFAPDKELRGCYLSEAWTTAAAAGQVVFSNMGGVLIDLDNDGYLGTGWVLVYWHVDQSERVAVGTQLEAGERVGHPSCEGGYSNGTHLHFARRYNGRWVSADGAIPFNLDGWVSAGLGREYDGLLLRGGEVKEACNCSEELNEIAR